MNVENVNIEQGFPQDGPKISFLEAFHGVLFTPKRTFNDLYTEDTFTVIVYGTLAVFLSNLGKLEPGNISILNIVGVEIIGFISWFLVGLLLFFFSTVFKTPNSNLARLLGFTGLSSIPFLLMSPVNLISNLSPGIFQVLEIIASVWAFILFWIALAKSFQLEAWRVLLMAIVPFLIGLFLFTFLLANIVGFLLSGVLFKR